MQWDELHVRLLDPRSGALLREHRTADRGRHRMAIDDQPSRTPRQVAALLLRAHGIGVANGAIVDALHAENRATGVRHILGLCALAKKHGTSVVESAAKVALEAGPPSYRFIRTYVERHQTAPPALRQIDPLIRGLTEYRNLIHRATEGDPNERRRD